MSFKLRGVRWRTTAAATLTVAVSLAVAGLIFAFAQRDQLESSITEAATDQASDISAQVARDGAGADLAAGSGDQSLVQILDAAGKVVAASPSVEGESPVVQARPGPGDAAIIRSQDLPIGEGEAFVVVARGVMGPEGPMVVLVAQSLELVDQSTAVVVNLLLIGYPVVLIGVALTSYWLAGRALAPVEAIRSRVAQVQGTAGLHARVPVPDGDDEITRLAVTMNAMLERLQVGSERQRRFVGDASHELRSPLATIRAAPWPASWRRRRARCRVGRPKATFRCRCSRPTPSRLDCSAAASVRCRNRCSSMATTMVTRAPVHTEASSMTEPDRNHEDSATAKRRRVWDKAASNYDRQIRVLDKGLVRRPSRVARRTCPGQGSD